MSRRRSAPLLLFVLLAAGGCGGDDGGTPTAAAGTTTVQSVTTAARTITTTAPDTTVTVPAPSVGTTPSVPDAAATTADSAASTARAAYIARADRVCRTANAATRRLNTRANAAIRGAKDDADRLAALAPILEEGASSQKAALARFVALAPPAADRPAIERYWAALRRQSGLVEDLATAAAAGDVEAYTRTARRSAALREEARALARAYGFTECGSDKSDAA